MRALIWLTMAGCWGRPFATVEAEGPPEADRCAPDRPGTRCWVHVDGGTLRRGAQSTDPSGPGYDPRAAPDEAPVTEVTVSPFWMYKTEVAASMFGACLRAGVCRQEDVSSGGGFSTFKLLEETAKVTVPITSITWDGAARLCSWMGGRLPTEAEWERAARGDGGRVFPWGDEPACGVSKFVTGPPPEPGVDRLQMMTGACSLSGPVPTHDALGASPFGVLGMAGNVWEWTADWYAPDAYAHGGLVDPRGPASGAERVQRGGGWIQSDPWELRAAGRAHMPPDTRINDVGVRCVWGADR